MGCMADRRWNFLKKPGCGQRSFLPWHNADGNFRPAVSHLQSRRGDDSSVICTGLCDLLLAGAADTEGSTGTVGKSGTAEIADAESIKKCW